MSLARLDLVAPHLFDALAAAAAGGDTSALNLANFLARGDYHPVDDPTRDLSLEARVLALLGAPPSDALALAGLYAALDFDLPSAPTDLVCVEPVYLRADATRVVLFDTAAVGIDAAEADALIDHLNQGLGGDAPVFSRGAAPGRWYLQTTLAEPMSVASPRALRGSQVEDSLHALRRLGALNRLLTEAQMVLHDVPINDARAAAGRPPLNGVWLWGGGTPPVCDGHRYAALAGDDDLARACARHLRLPHHATVGAGVEAASSGANVLAVLDIAPGGALPFKALLREMLEPARARHVRVVIHARQARLEVTSAARWRVWRRGAALLARLRAHQLGEAGDANG